MYLFSHILHGLAVFLPSPSYSLLWECIGKENQSHTTLVWWWLLLHRPITLPWQYQREQQSWAAPSLPLSTSMRHLQEIASYFSRQEVKRQQHPCMCHFLRSGLGWEWALRAHTNAAWGAVEEYCPGEERPGSATEAELYLTTGMIILELLRQCIWNCSRFGTALDPLSFGL